MKSKFVSVVVCLAFVAMLAVPAALAPVASADAILPVWSVGDSWNYNTSYDNGAGSTQTGVMNTTVTGTTDPNYTLSADYVPDALRFTLIPPATWSPVTVLSTDISVRKSNMQFQQYYATILAYGVLPDNATIAWNYPTHPSWPPITGSTWNFTKNTSDDLGIVNYTVNRQGKVLGVEDVTVPAGTFSCYHIVEYDPAVPGTYTFEYWFNDTLVGSNVKMIDSETYQGVETRELASFSHGPIIASVVPESGPPGTQVTVNGSGFGSSRGAGTGRKSNAASYVSFNGVAATEYESWSDTQIVCTVPEGAGPGPITVVTSAGTSNADHTFTVVCPTWYLAEGTTDWGFSEYISIENPNPTAVTALVTYMTKSGPSVKGNIILPAQSQTTINPKDDIGETDFSTKVECLDNATIAVDRTMSWTGPGAASPEAHNSVGVTSPQKTWYLAEGSSDWNFECWLLIQNPNTTEATATVTYMIEGAAPVTVIKKVPASSRATFNMADDIGAKDASIKVEADIPVIPERAMYRNNRREGHDSIGTTAPATDYYLAEGTTDYGFTTYVLVQNPNDTAANVTVTYMTNSGPQPQAPFQMPANSRKTIRVNDILPSKDLSTQVHADVPIIAERAMYWGADKPLGEACHDSIGMAMAHQTFYLPDGQTSEGRETWTLVQNPNTEQVTVEITYMTPTGAGNVVKTETIPASSRQTFGMLEHSGINGRAAIMVTSKTAGKKIMVERAMYWNNRGAGTDTIGGYSD